MKKNQLSALLQKMSPHSLLESEKGENLEIISLDDQMSQLIVGGTVEPTKNGTCAGNNANCANTTCPGSSNGVCGNASCEMPKAPVIPVSVLL